MTQEVIPADALRKSPVQFGPETSLDNGERYLDGGLLGPRSHVQQTVLRHSCLLYVCWHRHLTISMETVLRANEVSCMSLERVGYQNRL